jgi:hypothetical protein
MTETPGQSGIARFARIAASALDVAILECGSGRAELCLQTLETLRMLCAEIVDAAATGPAGQPRREQP